jgi:hypothetical protein
MAVQNTCSLSRVALVASLLASASAALPSLPSHPCPQQPPTSSVSPPAAGAAERLATPAPPAPQPSALAGQNAAPAGDAWVRWLKGGRYWVHARLRYEDVDQDGFAKRANAFTLRTVLGMQTADWKGFSGTLEFEDVTALFADDYNSTTNGNTQFPTVVDPEGAEINQAFLEHDRKGSWNGRVGRQRITFDNHRFIGNVGWRQNEQTFDALQLRAGNIQGIEAVYAYVDNVNRINGDASAVGDLPSHSHLVHLSRSVGAAGSLSAYAYLLDSGSVPANSLDTYGARLAGKYSAPSKSWGLQWTAEAAYQQDAQDNPNDVEQEYLFGELGGSLDRFTLLLGDELLGGSGQTGDAFQTPLATLHAFNGWADKFLTTPDAGLEDRYVSLEARVGSGKGQVVWHDFHADRGDTHYGSELDFAATWPIRPELTAGVKYALYDASNFATDTEKFWIWLTLTL